MKVILQIKILGSNFGIQLNDRHPLFSPALKCKTATAFSFVLWIPSMRGNFPLYCSHNFRNLSLFRFSSVFSEVISDVTASIALLPKLNVRFFRWISCRSASARTDFSASPKTLFPGILNFVASSRDVVPPPLPLFTRAREDEPFALRELSESYSGVGRSFHKFSVLPSYGFESKKINQSFFACDREGNLALLVWKKTINFATWWRHFSGQSIKIAFSTTNIAPTGGKILDIFIVVVSRRSFELI